MPNIWQYRYIPRMLPLSVRWQTYYDITDISHEFISCQWDDKHMTLHKYTMNSFPVSEMTNIWHYRCIPWIHSPSVRWQTYDSTDIYHEFIPCQWEDKHMTLQIYTLNSFHQWDDKHMTLQIYTMNSFSVSEMTNIWHYRYEQEYGIWTFGFFWYPNG